MTTFEINGNTYVAKDFDFNLICDLEDKGVSMDSMSEKPMSMFRAYIAVCANKSVRFAGMEMQNHFINGGDLEELTEIISQKMDESDFFQAMNQTETKEAPKKQTRKAKAE